MIYPSAETYSSSFLEKKYAASQGAVISIHISLNQSSLNQANKYGSKSAEPHSEDQYLTSEIRGGGQCFGSIKINKGFVSGTEMFSLQADI